MTDVAEIVAAVRSDVRAKLLDLLDEVAGRKVLLFDSSIMRPLDLVVSLGDLKDHGVQQWYKLENQPVTTDCAQMIFLVRSERVDLVDMIAKQIHADEREAKDRLYLVVLIPEKTEHCKQRLAEHNVKANVRITGCAIHHFPSDKDVLSMETPRMFQRLHCENDVSGPYYAALGIMSLQEKFGTIATVHAIGYAGKIVVDTIQRLRKEQNAGQSKKKGDSTNQQPGVPPVAPMMNGAAAMRRKEENVASGNPALSVNTEAAEKEKGAISEMVIIDRRVDLFSVLCSQFTYQALIDFAYGIQNNSIDVSSAAWYKGKERNSSAASGGASGASGATVRFSEDALFQEIRDLRIDKLGPLLQEKARAIQQTYSEKDNVKSASEMMEYIPKFKNAQSAHPLLEVYINLAHDLNEKIQSEEYRQLLKLEDEITAQSGSSSNTLDFVQAMMDDQKPFHEALRLLCLHSLVNNGIKKQQLESLKTAFKQSYGFEHTLTLENMEGAGLLRQQQGKSGWGSIKRQFNLFVEDGTDQDVSYAYSGYAPLSVRLVQMTRSQPKGWIAVKDALSLLHGPAQELQQPAVREQDPRKPQLVLVCFLGGVTYGEIAALRRLAQLEEGRRRFLIVTSEYINPKKLFESMRCEAVLNLPPLDATKTAASGEARRGFGGFWPTAR